MGIRDLKYGLAFLPPIVAGLAIHVGGIVSPAAALLLFVVLPTVETLVPVDRRNLAPEAEARRAASRFFDLLLYLNLPILYALLGLYLARIAAGGLSAYEAVGMTLSIGVVLGSTGINVAHEIGHRVGRLDQLVARALLLPSLYMHFNVEHNRGHHRRVATDEDPASARRGESLYRFWSRSVSGSYLHAWSLERRRLSRLGRVPWGPANLMIVFSATQVAYLVGVGLLLGRAAIAYSVAAAVVGVLMLETVNYIEHYGLRRAKLADGRYERVRPCHSWSSDHQLGRIVLYELTRHSDHHLLASRRYQILRSFEQAPQLPFGYPASMLLASVPPLWFAVMDRELDRLAARG